jgi:hypothetical protein
LKAYSLKSLQKFSSLRDWFSTMDEFVSKFDSQGRLVGLRFSQAAIPQQVTFDSEDCREFFASAAEQQWQLYPVFVPSESSPSFRTEGACFANSGSARHLDVASD